MIELKTIGLFMVLFVAVMSSSVYAQHNHGGGGHSDHQSNTDHPPHGGEMKEVGKYHIEMVVDALMIEDQITFYLFKGNMKRISNDGITGSITFNYKDGSSSTEELKIKGDSRFVAQLKDSGSFNSIVKFTMNGKVLSTVFSYSGSGYNTSSAYSCSMHPEIQEDGPGKCPKCGMNLVKQ